MTRIVYMYIQSVYMCGKKATRQANLRLVLKGLVSPYVRRALDKLQLVCNVLGCPDKDSFLF